MQRHVLHVSSPFLRLVFILILACSGLLVHGQVESDPIQIDTIVEVKKGSIFKGRPGKAMLFSLVIPGAGQLYNKSYWRVPIVWAAVGGVGYLLKTKSDQYRWARDAYKARIDDTFFDASKVKPADLQLALIGGTDDTIRKIRDNANENRQLTIIGFSFLWLANGIDAFVDAHLKDFNVDDDLSINFSTRLDNDPFAPMRVGMFLTLNKSGTTPPFFK